MKGYSKPTVIAVMTMPFGMSNGAVIDEAVWCMARGAGRSMTHAAALAMRALEAERSDQAHAASRFKLLHKHPAKAMMRNVLALDDAYETTEETEDDGAQTIMLADADAWTNFVNAGDNRQAIIDACGSLEKGYRLACEGGLILGGGAAPLFYIRFEG